MKYTIVAGDTLSKIASKMFDPSLGLSYKDLAGYNGIANPNLIRVGQILDIPDSVANPDIIFGPSGAPNISTPNAPAPYHPQVRTTHPVAPGSQPAGNATGALFGIPYKWFMFAGIGAIVFAVVFNKKR